MMGKLPKRATKGEHAYIRELERASPFEVVDLGRGQILSQRDYPKPLKRFLRRERTMVHVRLSPALKRKLESRGRQAGLPIDELARRWITNALKRDAG